MESKDLPWDLKVRMRRHFRYLWSRSITLGVAEAEILHQLSTPLRAEALRHMHRTLLQENPIFSMVDDPTFRDKLMRSLRPLFISMTEKLIAQGTMGDELFILARGALAVYVDTSVAHAAAAPSASSAPGELADSNVWVAEVLAGNPTSCVGEVALLPELGCKKMRSATVMAQSHCELYSFAGAELNALLEDFAKANKFFYELAKERLACSQDARDNKEREDRIRQHQGSVKAMQFGQKLLSKKLQREREAMAELDELNKPTNTVGGLVKYMQEPEPISHEDRVSLRLDQLEAKLENLTHILVGGVHDLKAAVRKAGQ